MNAFGLWWSILLSMVFGTALFAESDKEPGEDVPAQEESPPPASQDAPTPPAISPEVQAYIDNVILKGVRQEGREAGQRKLLQTLGVESADQAAALIKAAADAEAAKLSDIERLQSQVEKARQEAAKAKEQATTALVRAALEQEAHRRGMEAAQVVTFFEKFGKLDSLAVDIEQGTVDGIAAVVDALVATLPATEPSKTWVKQGSGGKDSGLPTSVATQHITRRYSGPKRTR